MYLGNKKFENTKHRNNESDKEKNSKLNSNS